MQQDSARLEAFLRERGLSQAKLAMLALSPPGGLGTSRADLVIERLRDIRPQPTRASVPPSPR